MDHELDGSDDGDDFVLTVLEKLTLRLGARCRGAVGPGLVPLIFILGIFTSLSLLGDSQRRGIVVVRREDFGLSTNAEALPFLLVSVVVASWSKLYVFSILPRGDLLEKPLRLSVSGGGETHREELERGVEGLLPLLLVDDGGGNILV